MRLGELDPRLVVVGGAEAKGLEFDAVVVVEPARFVALGPAGVRLLYIALTRAVQELVVVHAQPLPAQLSATPWA
jgi:DNA helicase IV